MTGSRLNVTTRLFPYLSQNRGGDGHVPAAGSVSPEAALSTAEDQLSP
jgi:hypothetical protein